MPTLPIKLVLPTTCRLFCGAVVPIPTLNGKLFKVTSEPSTSELLRLTVANAPIAVAKDTSPADCWAAKPMKVLLSPVWMARPADCPTNVFRRPVVLLRPAESPKKAFSVPLDALFSPALGPAKKLLVPKLLSMRAPPRLNCVPALSAPPTVPLPEMLKFVLDCGLFVF